MNISQETQQQFEYIKRVRRHLHAHPEASLKEFETSAFIQGELKDMGIPYEVVGKTGVFGVIHGKQPGKTILLRADMDALEVEDKKTVEYASTSVGMHHACGHDGHTAALLAAAHLLKEKEQEISGTVKLCFQHAEEIGAGAREFVQGGHLKDVDFCYAFHVTPLEDVGTVCAIPGPNCASSDIFKIHVQGEGAHCARPHHGKDAALATAAILVELQSLVARRVDPHSPAVISVGKISAGTRYNIMASEGVLEGALRTLDESLRQELLARIEHIAKHVAAVHDCIATFENYDAGGVLINNDAVTEYTQRIAAEIVGEEHVVKESVPSMGAEDFADFTQVVPGTYVHIGTRANPDTAYPLHHEKFDITEEALLIATQMYVDMVMKQELYTQK